MAKQKLLFSNATEFMVWQDNNCCLCAKAVWYNEKTNNWPSYRCTIQKNIELAAVTDGTGNEQTYKAVINAVCPYRQTKEERRQIRLKAKENLKQLKLEL